MLMTPAAHRLLNVQADGVSTVKGHDSHIPVTTNEGSLSDTTVYMYTEAYANLGLLA